MGIQEWLGTKGFNASVVTDGQIHRDARLGHSSKSAWYVAWSEPFPICVAGDWRTGEKWEYKNSDRKTLAETRHAQKLMAQAAAEAEKEREGKAKRAALRADIELRSGAPANGHPYLIAKMIQPHGAVQAGDDLLIPMHDHKGLTWGLQRIVRGGGKFFLPGQRAAGCFYAIGGKVTTQLYIAEGFATGASVYEATGVPTWCAFSASNLIRVAATAKRYHDRAKIILAADNDTYTEGNPGIAAAESTAKTLGPMCVAVPTFTAPGRLTDFNDLACHEGTFEVWRQLQNATEFPRGVGEQWSRKYSQILREVQNG